MQALFLHLTVFCISSRKFWGPLPLKLQTIQALYAPYFGKMRRRRNSWRSQFMQPQGCYSSQPQSCNSSRPKVAPSPKTPHDTFRQRGLCEQSASRRSDRQATALRASTAQSLRDFSAQDDTRGEMSVKIYHDPVGATCGRQLVGFAPLEGGRSQIAPTIL